MIKLQSGSAPDVDSGRSFRWFFQGFPKVLQEGSPKASPRPPKASPRRPQSLPRRPQRLPDASQERLRGVFSRFLGCFFLTLTRGRPQTSTLENPSKTSTGATKFKVRAFRKSLQTMKKSINNLFGSLFRRYLYKDFPKMAPRSFQDAPKEPQGAFKTVPGAPRECPGASRSVSGAPFSVPGASPERPGSALGASQNPPRCSRGAPERSGTDFESVLVPKSARSRRLCLYGLGVREGSASQAWLVQDVHEGSASGVPTFDCSLGLFHPLAVDLEGCLFLMFLSGCPVIAGLSKRFIQTFLSSGFCARLLLEVSSFFVHCTKAL